MSKYRIVPLILGTLLFVAGLAIIAFCNSYIITVIGLFVIWYGSTHFKVALTGSDESIEKMCTTDTRTKIDDQSRREIHETINQINTAHQRHTKNDEYVNTDMENDKYENETTAALEILIHNASNVVENILLKDDYTCFKYKKCQKLHEDISCCYVATFMLMISDDLASNSYISIKNSIENNFALYLDEFYSELLEETDIEFSETIPSISKNDLLLKLSNYFDEIVSYAESHDVATISKACASIVNRLLIKRPYNLSKQCSEISEILSSTFPTSDMNIIHKRLIDKSIGV